MTQPSPGALEEQRRRLYRAGATADDVRRYREQVPEEAPPAERPAEPTTRRAFRGHSTLIAGGVLLAGLAAVAIGGPHAAAPLRTPTPTPTATLFTLRAAAGGADVTWAEAGIVLTFHGSGSQTLPLESDLVPRGGAMTVALAPALRAPVGWRLLRGSAIGGGTPQVLAERTVAGSGAADAPVDLSFAGGPPTAIGVQAPPGTGWTLIVTWLRPAG